MVYIQVTGDWWHNWCAFGCGHALPILVSIHLSVKLLRVGFYSVLVQQKELGMHRNSTAVGKSTTTWMLQHGIIICTKPIVWKTNYHLSARFDGKAMEIFASSARFHVRARREDGIIIVLCGLILRLNLRHGRNVRLKRGPQTYKRTKELLNLKERDEIILGAALAYHSKFWYISWQSSCFVLPGKKKIRGAP